MGRKLYVGNLPFETGEDELRQLFAQIGSVDAVNVMRDMATGRARGFAFVEMGTDEGARKAIDELNAKQFNGRALTVNEARPRPERSGGFGGGGGAAAADVAAAVVVAAADAPSRAPLVVAGTAGQVPGRESRRRDSSARRQAARGRCPPATYGEPVSGAGTRRRAVR